jgi:hypothetical protein
MCAGSSLDVNASFCKCIYDLDHDAGSQQTRLEEVVELAAQLLLPFC